MIQGLPKRLFRKLIGKYFIPNTQFSYSQFGEDLIIAHLFYHLEIQKPSYLDIGANEPKFISNTYYFYEHGGSGVLIEPNPYLASKLKRQRPGDTVLEIGIADKEDELDFYVFPNYANGLSTFSETEAKHWEEVGMKGLGKIPVEKKIKRKVVPVNDILQEYFAHKAPDLVSMDVEGLDLQILKSIDFTKFKPNVICVETLQYDDNQKTFKNNEIINFMLEKGYGVYADTRVNTIFCRRELY